jgi:hypothetical protein
MYVLSIQISLYVHSDRDSLFVYSDCDPYLSAFLQPNLDADVYDCRAHVS